MVLVLCTWFNEEDPSQHARKIVEWNVKNQAKQTNKNYMNDFQSEDSWSDSTLFLEDLKMLYCGG